MKIIFWDMSANWEGLKEQRWGSGDLCFLPVLRVRIQLIWEDLDPDPLNLGGSGST